MNMLNSSNDQMLFGMIRGEDQSQMTQQQQQHSTTSTAPASAQKKKRNLPGTPNPDAEIIALSPKTLMATNRFICEVCNKGFQREQNLQLHRRGHNLPWKLKQKSTKEVKKKVYLCPEPTCVHHDPSRPLGDLTGIKKHYSRKHGEKKYKCDKCSKRYAVQSDWKAHSKTCGTREYRCDCGTLFSRRDSFITHRAFCDALAQETARHPSSISTMGSHLFGHSPMNLNLSQGISTQIPSNNMLRLGSGSGTKLEQLSNPSSLFNTQLPPQSMPSSPFFMPPPDSSNQRFPELQSRPFHGLMQLSDHLQSTSSNSTNSGSAVAANANLFNLSFYSSSNPTNSVSNSVDGTNNNPSFQMPDHQYGNGVGSSHLSTLYNTNDQQNQAAPAPMSATALLQKAAQMGSATSNTSATLLKGVSSSGGANKFFGSNGNTENRNQQLQGLMNSFTNGMFGNVGADHQHQDNSFAGFSGNTLRLDHLQQQNFGNVEETAGKMNQNYSPSMGGSSSDNRMTLDFLGIGGGGRARDLSGGFSQKEQQHGGPAGVGGNEITPLDQPRQTRHVFGSPNLQ